MKIKRSIFAIVIFLFVILITLNSFALAPTTVGTTLDPTQAMSGMNGGGTVDSSVSTTFGPIINAAIGLIQIAGTGLSLVMVSILGIKYMIASPNDKADVKKQIAPMVVGCVILFASVNIIQIIANFTATVLTVQ